MFHRYFPACDGEETRQARLAGEQIVEGIVESPLRYLISNRKNTPFLIVKKSQSHAALQLLALGDQLVQLRELLGGGLARAFRLGDEKIEPLAHGRRKLRFLMLPVKCEQRHQPGDSLRGDVSQ